MQADTNKIFTILNIHSHKKKCIGSNYGSIKNKKKFIDISLCMYVHNMHECVFLCVCVLFRHSNVVNLLYITWFRVQSHLR